MEIQELSLGEFLEKFPQARPHINQYTVLFQERRPIISLDKDKKLFELFNEKQLRSLEYYIL